MSSPDGMRALTFVRPGELEWREAPDPTLEGDGEALVRPVAATTCDLDQLIIRGEAPFAGPFAIGHECVAEVVDLGDRVEGLEVGQRVIVPYHINCGRCGTCRAGLTAHCEAVPYGAMFGLPTAGEWGGVFSDLVRIPFADGMLVPAPSELDLRAIVSAGDNLALALECVVATLRANPKADVLILGALSVGLYATQIALALGAARVVYVDSDERRRRFASELGADATDEPPGRREGAFHLALDAAANPEWLQRAVTLLTPEGNLECPSLYFDEVSLPLLPMAVRGVRLHTGRGNAGGHIADALRLITDETIRPEAIVSESLPWDDAPEALSDPSVKPLFVR